MPEFLRDPEFWVLVSALVLFAAVGKPVMRSLTGALDTRADRIRAELDEARRLHEEAERMLVDYRRREHDATAEAEAILAHARDAAERMAEQAARDLEAALERRHRLAEERIAQAQAQAVAEIRTAAIDLAIAAARELIAGGLDAGRRAALVDDAIASLGRQLH